jgi:hypothetical protein
VELATGAAARALAVSVATSFAESAILAFLAHVFPAPEAAPPGRRPVPPVPPPPARLCSGAPRSDTGGRDRQRTGGQATPRVSGARSRRGIRARGAAGGASRRGPGDQTR